MKKLLSAVLALFSAVAFAQSYPSPHFNNVTVDGTLTGKISSTGSTITNATITGGTISGLTSPLPVASGGTNSASASGTVLDNITGFASTGFMSRTGAGAYSFTASTGTGSVVLATSPTLVTPNLGTPSAVTLTNGTGLPLTGLAAQAANTVVANVTGSSASPTAVALPSCSASSDALNYTSGAGWSCNTSINAATLGGATFASPGSIGIGTPGTGAFTTLSTTTSIGNSIVVNATANTASGAQIELSGNGATTPNKYIRAFSGSFQVVNSANMAVLFGIDDSGNVSGIANLAATGVSSFGNQTTWLASLINCTTNCATAWAQSPVGEVGTLGATRTSDNTLAGSMAAQGVAGYVINDNTTQVQTGYAAYLEARKMTGAGNTHGMEIDEVNQGSVVAMDPYGMTSTGITPALWLSSGRTDVTSGAANASAAIGVINNHTAFENGLIFQDGAIDNTSGEGSTVVMPAGDAILWYGAASTKVARIRSDATSAAGGIVFSNGAINFQNMAGSELLDINASTGAQRYDVAPTTGWQHDATGSTVTIANGANAVLAAGNGVVWVEESINSHSAGYLCSTGACTQFAGTGGNWVASTTTPSAGHLSVAYNGSTGYAIYNNEGATEVVTVGSIRMKASN